MRGGARAAPPDPPPLPSKDIRRRQNCSQRGPDASAPHGHTRPGRAQSCPGKAAPAPVGVCGAPRPPTEEASPAAGGARAADAR